MRERVGQLVGRSVRAMWVTTFHSACARMLRADAERLGYSRSFTIYDESDSLRMLKRCMAELGVDPKRYPPRAIRSKISGAKNQLIDADAYAQAQGSVFEEIVAEAFPLYEKRMLEANAMDFDDLLVRTVNALELFEEVRERWRRTFRHVLVDEYQDTNHAQYRLLQLLAAEHGNLMVVGDEDQSIYGFRHADIRNILDFERDFPEAEVVKLEQNYRSTQTILSAANAVVERNRERRPKELWTEDRGRRAGAALRARPTSTRRRAGSRARSSGSARRRASGAPDVAVFYRTNAMSRVLEDTLVRFDVPYQVIGGTKFYERAEVKDAVAYLSLLANPADQVSFARDRQLAAARDRQHQPGPARLPRQHHRADDLGGDRAGRGGAGAERRRDQGGLPLLRDDGRAARTRRRRRPGRRRCCEAVLQRDAATWKRWRPSARSRPKAGPRTSRRWSAAPPSSTSSASARARARCRRWRSTCSRSRSTPSRTRSQRRAGAGDADDPAQRQGPRVRHGLRRRLRGRRLPAHAGARRGRRRGGAAPLLRRHHPRPPAPLHDLGARAAAVRARRAQPALALHRRAAGRADRAPLERRPPAAASSWDTPAPAVDAGAAGRSRARRWSCRPATTSSTPASATASSPRSSPAAWSSSASPATAPSAS